MWPGSRRRSRRSPTRSGPTTSTGSRCSATRSSCSITCTCRSSRPAAGCCAWRSRSASWCRSIPPWCCWPPRRCRRAHIDMAARNRAPVAGAGGAARPVGPAPVHDRDDGRLRQGGAGGRHLRPGGGGAARRLGAQLRPGGGGPLGFGGVACRGVAGVRRRVRGGDRLRLGGYGSTGRTGAAGAGGGGAALGLRRCHRRRDRFPARHLDGRLAPAGVARGLCGRHGGHRGPSGAGRPARRHPARAPLVRVPGHLTAGPGRRFADAPGGGRRRPGGRERRRQDDAREAPREAVRAHVGGHPGRRHTPRRHRSGSVAGAARGRLPGLLPLRVPRAPDGRGRRRAARG